MVSPVSFNDSVLVSVDNVSSLVQFVSYMRSGAFVHLRDCNRDGLWLCKMTD